MLSTDELLENAARDGSLQDWPRLLPDILARLHHNVYNEFPLPSLPLPAPLPPPIDPQVVASTPPPEIPASDAETTEELPDADHELPPNSQSSTKENDAPTELAAGRPPSIPQSGFGGFDVSEPQRTEGMAPPQQEIEPGTLPPDFLHLYQSSIHILEYDFAQSPPYTLQRLAELVLRPKKHYRFLPAYLRALDRIVSVNSPVSDFPLPTLHSSLNGGFLTNGEAQVNGISEREGLGSDESLGGALLTPIPWLRHQGNMLSASGSASGTDGELHSESTETIEGPHGAGSIETVSVTVNGISSATALSHTAGASSPITSPTLSEQSDASTSSSASTEAQLREQGGVTQGELLRQEQEAGVVPVNPAGHPMTPRRTLIAGGAAAVGRDVPASGGPAATTEVPLDEEQPHARGPEVIGMEDMGPQPHPVERGSAVLDMEAAVGRGRSKSPQPPPATDTNQEDESMEEASDAHPDSDIEKDVEKLKEAMDREEAGAQKDQDGDVQVEDAEPKSDSSVPEVKEDAADDSK